MSTTVRLVALASTCLGLLLSACADDATTVVPANDTAVEADVPIDVPSDANVSKDAADADSGEALGPDTTPVDGVAGDVSEAMEPEAAEVGPEPTDATAPDAGPDVAPDVVDVGPDTATCPPPADTSYTCHAEDPATCPGGVCLAGLCIASVADPDRWASCADGACGVCETADACPADCGATPTLTGAKVYDDAATLNVWLHGWSNKNQGDLSTMVYGEASGCGGMFEDLRAFGIDRPCYDDPGGADAPDQMVKIEYWGSVAPEWMSAADRAEIEALPYDEGTTSLLRYAKVAAKAIRHRLQVTGAAHVNLACHSFGCLVARTMIERDLEHLASEQRIVRWFTSAGVLAGARLSRLYDNVDVQNVGALLGFNLQDWVIMNPDFVQDNVAAWDHRLHEGNNPLFANVLIHHVAGTDPHVKSALDIQLLDLNNPGDEPNDGIMYSFDTFFHAQAPVASMHLPNGQVLPATHSFVHEYHEFVSEHPGFHVLAAAGLFHSRKVLITLRSLELKDDREKDDLFGAENGAPPAEIAFETEVRYNPYVLETFGRDVLVAEQRVSDRSPDLFTEEEGQTILPQRRVFEGPIFDAMTELHLDLVLLEVDWYPRFGVLEWAFDVDQALAEVHTQIPLVDGIVPFESQYVKGELKVEVKTLY